MTDVAHEDPGSDAAEDARERDIASHVRVVREGHGANCSSIGSVIDTLFVAQLAASALFVAVAAALVTDAKPAATDPKAPERARDDAESK